tara:strand:+ start:1556 stop:1660 length:105 start_codon:yes stop_codon:yes gene_type:complete
MTYKFGNDLLIIEEVENFAFIYSCNFKKTSIKYI